MEMRAMYAQCLAELMERDEKLVLLDADLSKACGTFPLRKRFPDRIYDCGVAEQNMISIAAGLASYGFKPWAESFAPFATRRVCDQIAISVCYAKRNVKIVGTDPGIAAELNGGTHMSLEDMGVVRSIPGLVIFEPTDTVQLTTAAENAEAVEAVLNPTQRRSLSNSVLETLAIVAYRQPVTRGEIEEVRGVRCEYAVERLLKLGLIAIAGRKDVPGRPMLLVTTDTFLHKFNLTSLEDLPRLPQELFETV